MIASIVALALIGHQSGWADTASRFRDIAETYKKWGITFEVDTSKRFTAADGPMPGELEVSGSMESPDSLKLKMKATAGEKQALAIDLGGTFKIDPDGTATEGNGAVYLEGSGLAGKFTYDKANGLNLETGLEETFYSLGIKLGNPNEGIFGLGLKLGPLTVNIDPAKWAHRFQEMAPEMAKAGAKKIGGVTLAVDADAMTAAIANDADPPERFLQNRELVSLKALAASGAATLGDLNDLQGVLVDEKNQDVLLVGSHNDALPALSSDVLATLARSVYEADLHPYISIDPQSGDLSLPHRARIGDVPQDLRSSELVKDMLTADYSMKRIQIGDKKLEGIPELIDLIDTNQSIQFGAVGRFWINPRPLTPGDVKLAKGSDSRYYEIPTTPLILSEAMQTNAPVAAVPSLDLYGDTDAFKKEVDQMARTLTSDYSMVEREWPESGFGAARQALQISNILTLVRQEERRPWMDALMHAVGSRPIPSVDVPKEFPGLRSTRSVTVNGQETWVQGGMTTDAEIPDPVSGGEAIDPASLSLEDGVASLAPPTPTAEEPSVMTPDQVAADYLSEAQIALKALDYNGAVRSAAGALLCKPDWVEAEVVVLSGLAGEGDTADFEAELADAIKAHPKAWQLLYFQAIYSEQLARDAAGEFGYVADNHREAACEMAKQVVKLQPKFAEAYALLGRVEHESEIDDYSLDYWNKAISINPQSPEYHLGRAAVLISQKKYAVGLTDLNAALAVSPLSAPTFIVRGEVLAKMGRIDEAVKDLESAVRLSPSDWLAWDLLGQMRFAKGADQAAIDAFGNALALVPKDTIQQAEEENGDIFIPKPFRIPIDPLENFTERFGDAPRNLIDSITLVDPQIWLERGKAYYHLSRWNEALTDFKWYLAAYPEKRPSVAKLMDACTARIGGGH